MLAPQVGLEQSHFIQPLAQIHNHFGTNTGKGKGYAISNLAPTTSSEIAKIARMGIPAVQKQYIFGSSLRTGWDAIVGLANDAVQALFGDSRPPLAPSMRWRFPNPDDAGSV